VKTIVSFPVKQSILNNVIVGTVLPYFSLIARATYYGQKRVQTVGAGKQLLRVGGNPKLYMLPT
jgi:hypothetical protein